jgi:SRSO17 transposase
MIRRSIDDSELAFYHCYNPRREPAGELVRIAGTRWPVEECLQTGKGSVGLDNYQVRLYHAWYRHITLAMIAQSFLAILAHRHRAKKGDPQTAAPPPQQSPPPKPPPPKPPRPKRQSAGPAASQIRRSDGGST